MADFKPGVSTPAPAPAPDSAGSGGGGSFLEDSIGALFNLMFSFVAWLLEISYFILLSVLVVPSMLIMMWLHKSWEDQLKKHFHIGY